MTHRHDREDAESVAYVERSAHPAAYTIVEGGQWLAAPIPTTSSPHSIWFDNGKMWDEHNGWRGEKFDEPFDASRIGWLD